MTIGFVDKAQVQCFQKALNEDAEFCLASRRLSADILLRVGADRCFVKVREGCVPDMVVVNSGEFNISGCDTSIGASEEIWTELLKSRPAAGYSDLIPAAAWYGLELSGNVLLQHTFNRAITRMVDIFREVHTGEKRAFSPPQLPPEGTIESIIGKYIHIELASAKYRVYFEESGNPSGIPLICQHTAGADCRQWRHLLNDEKVAAKFRIIAHDLPYHGKSLPPANIEWWKHEYRLDETLGLEFPAALVRALNLHRPVYIGASIGGMIASDLPWKHPGLFRAVIACEAAEYKPDWGVMLPIMTDPRCRTITTDMSFCQSPLIPIQNNRECSWVNDGNAFGLAGGDAYYYTDVHDLRDKLHLIDTSKTAYYIMNGEYDLATPPSDAEALAAKIPGAKAIALMGLGHFPHCEDYDVFKGYLHPVLDEIAAV